MTTFADLSVFLHPVVWFCRIKGRGVRVVEGARLESVYTGNRIEGSNPSLSASQANRPERAVLVWWDEGNLFPKGPPNQKGRHSRRFAGVMLGPPSGMSERSEDNP